MITEPQAVTQKEIDGINPETQKVIYYQAGMANGSIKTLPAIVDKTPIEIENYKKEKTLIKCKELRDLIVDNLATSDDIMALDVLLKSLDVL